MKMDKSYRNSGRAGLLAALIVLFAGIAGTPASAAEITVYKSPWCGCCSKWVDHLRGHGHSVAIKDVEDLDAIKRMAGVPERLQSCHTAMVDGYVIEGHVPARDLDRLLSRRPEARGLAVPGMPVGAPGMEGGAPDRYDVLMFQPDGSVSVFSKH
jgi:hypothetical protein